MSRVQAKLAWSHFKKKLQKRSPWLGQFDKSAVAQAVERIQHTPRNYYEPLLLDIVLKEASEALDRCLAFRREAYDLEIAAVKAVADYELFKKLADIEEKLDLNALALKRLEEEETGYREASSKYNERGFAKHDETLANSAKADIEAAKERERLIKERYRTRREYEAEYYSRHVAAGNAHNFEERMKRTVPLLADDLQQAYEKLLAAHTGIWPAPGLVDTRLS